MLGVGLGKWCIKTQQEIHWKLINNATKKNKYSKHNKILLKITWECKKKLPEIVQLHMP